LGTDSTPQTGESIHTSIGNRATWQLVAIAGAALIVLVGSPLMGWWPVVRLPAVLGPAIVAALLVTRPWTFGDLSRFALEWTPSRRFVGITAAAVFALLFWYVLTRFHSGQINAIDFTIYYDRPCFQTVHGRPLLVEVSDSPGYSHRSEFADHAYWGMLVVCSVYAVYASPVWLHALSAAAVVIGALGVLLVVRRQGLGGVLACASALSFVLNDNTARTLNYGFHPEVLYAGLVPWVVRAGLSGSGLQFCVLVLACVLVKEDAFLPLLGVSVSLALYRFRQMTPRERGVFLVFPAAAALANLALYYSVTVRMLTGAATPTYAHFWGNYGDTPVRAFVAMCHQPRRVLHGTFTSGIYKTLQPHLFLPLIGWRWSIGMLPLVLLYGASANEQVRAFGIYYAIVLVPFLTLGATSGAFAVARRISGGEGRARMCAAAILVAGALFVGVSDKGYSLRPWKAEIAATPDAVHALDGERIVLVQSGLFPHVGYDQRLQLLTPETLHDPGNDGAAILLAPDVSGYPFRRREIQALAQLKPIRPLAAGLVAVRRPQLIK